MNDYAYAKKSIVLNLIIIILVVFGLVMMVLDINFIKIDLVLATSGFEALKYFTVDSNIFALISSLILIIYEYFVIKKNICEIPKWVYVLKYVSTVSVVLTFLVTACFLVPTLKYEFWFFYINSNLFFHLIVPALSFISFCFYEKSNYITFKHIFLSIVPVILYGTFYSINVFSHMINGVVSLQYDFYGFLKYGINTIGLVIIIMLFVTFIIGFVLKKINSKVIFYTN